LQKRGHDDEEWKIPKGTPFGYSYFPMELTPTPVEWVKTTGEDGLQWSKRHDDVSLTPFRIVTVETESN
jgi:hypothetical protein